MSQSDIEVGRVLLYFERVIEEHNNTLDKLENYAQIPELDTEKIDVLIRRLRRTRKEILQGIETISNYVENVKDTKLKEEALGLINYFYVVGLEDEENVLRTLKERSASTDQNIDKDIETISKIRGLILKFIY
ncbi:hypothetical protein [Sulfolobus acidocaldarius]|uniref:Conserved protein n=4 Tax=Sulfolobus acidocaldarius TaxID=2285 RepID=Q4JAF2_SULAC|nr:hypothetical protein [Sulfolobus acidocaldarius]AAY80227.1 conserved protein [Sulfolobus acidocaldarius DSM 639]AGE70806.1 hypothetical protein SacN8_04175 [Sulfolobus acidocaldarius N8]AGE73077.1 hypothetical protein SacRon12I_04165 [Sulfolobus acidocaldarius Ron12/I]ALU28876.1 hypothetical protein ATY89_02120 [Sulfolobus acidocaldarius]ALU31598.1 hypothetical protein ATZ20_05155 [Sulfolobus acidocaldarius]